MPYIDSPNRMDLQYREALTPGELNYILTSLCDDYARTRDPNVGYAAINEVIGVLECAKLEFYRRIAAPYEDIKCKQNGDVYNT